MKNSVSYIESVQPYFELTTENFYKHSVSCEGKYWFYTFSSAKDENSRNVTFLPDGCTNLVIEYNDSVKASMVFNTILGDAMSSRLFETLREKNGICYSVYSYFSYYEDASMWCSVVSCSPKNVAKAKSLLEREVFSFMENPPDDNEISNAIEHLCGEETISSCDTEYAMKNLSRNFSMGLPLLTSSEVIDCIRSVKKNDIMDIAKSVIIRENSTFLVFSSGSRIDVK